MQRHGILMIKFGLLNSMVQKPPPFETGGRFKHYLASVGQVAGSEGVKTGVVERPHWAGLELELLVHVDKEMAA